eukprot:TRINITY_DN75411_c0_g1_i1.p1 TRINITY_DN75411_c0_g1~~TRINITY_DN75411_c0_g1_i1.p1  ORF type:complete len:320 (-),score=62.14 TRINITY_DN75411_c0_g1_i1:169-1029(-)
MSSSELVNELSVVNKLWALSTDYNNQPYIVRRGILPTLVKFLHSPEPQVTLLTAQCLEQLASHPDNPEYMCREKGLVSAVYKLYSLPDISPKLKTTLAAVLKHLSSALPAEETPRAVPSSSACPPSTTAASEPSEPPNRKKRNITLCLKGEAKAQLQDIDSCLRKHPGVISYSFNDQEQIATVYGTALPATVARALGDAGFPAEVVKDREAQRVEQAEQAEAPSYLPEEADTAESDYKRSLVTTGENSLAARLERRRQEKLREREMQKQQQGAMSSFFRKLTSAVW